jgi:hypothetical protein
MINELMNSLHKTDEYMTKTLKDIHLVLFNLKIEQSKLKETNGIQPIAEYLERTINDIDIHLKKSRDYVNKIIQEGDKN